MAQTLSSHPFSRTQEAGGATPLCKSPFSRRQACPKPGGHTRRGQAVRTCGCCPSAINNPEQLCKLDWSPNIHSLLPASPTIPQCLIKVPWLLTRYTEALCAQASWEETRKAQASQGDPGAGERDPCPLLCPSARNSYPEPTPNLATPTHPAHHLLSLQGDGGGHGEHQAAAFCCKPDFFHPSS